MLTFIQGAIAIGLLAIGAGIGQEVIEALIGLSVTFSLLAKHLNHLRDNLLYLDALLINLDALLGNTLPELVILALNLDALLGNTLPGDQSFDRFVQLSARLAVASPAA